MDAEDCAQFEAESNIQSLASWAFRKDGNARGIRTQAQKSNDPKCLHNTGALMIGTGFWGPLCQNDGKENNAGESFDPDITNRTCNTEHAQSANFMYTAYEKAYVWRRPWEPYKQNLVSPVPSTLRCF